MFPHRLTIPPRGSLHDPANDFLVLMLLLLFKASPMQRVYFQCSRSIPPIAAHKSDSGRDLVVQFSSTHPPLESDFALQDRAVKNGPC